MLNFTKDSAFVVDMEDYLKEILKGLLRDINDAAPTLVAYSV